MGPWPMGRAVEKKRKREGVVRGRADPPNMCRITRCLVVRDSPPAPTAAWPARPRQNQRSGPGPHFYASAPPLSAQQLCDGMRTLPIVLSFFFLSLSFFDSETVKEGQARCPPCHSPQVRLFSRRPPNKQQLACHARDGVQSQASVNKAGRVSPEMLLPGAKPACLPDRWNLERFVRPQRKHAPHPRKRARTAAQVEAWTWRHRVVYSKQRVFFHIQPASVPYRILSKAVN